MVELFGRASQGWRGLVKKVGPCPIGPAVVNQALP